MGVWTFPQGQDVGAAMTATGVGSALYGLGAFGHPQFLVPLVFLGAAAGLLSYGVVRWTRTPVPVLDDGDGMLLGDVPSEFLWHGELHPELQRLVNVAEARFPGKFMLDFEEVDFEDDKKGGKKLVSWGFRALTPGFLASDSMRASLQDLFLNSAGGRWKFDFQSAQDRFSATQKSSIPTLCFPPNWPVVTSAAEAKERYPKWEFSVGETADGPLGFCPETMPHILAVGETGGGKSVAVRSWLEQFRAMGWLLAMCDGKGADYAGYRGIPGVLAIGRGSGTRGMEYIATIYLVYSILMQRMDNSADAKIADPANWNKFTPILLVMDEIKSMMEKWRSSLSKAEFNQVVGMVTQILALGRELRVHALLVTQDARDVSIPGVWRSNLPLTISIGKPGPMTVQKGFAETVAPKVKLISETMDPNIKGRCLVASIDESTGRADATEYQGYIGYSPGESWDNPKIPAQARQYWPEFKAQVSDRVPQMYSRQWFMVQEKSQAQEKAEVKSGDLGYIDFDQFTVDEIMNLDRVTLDERVGGTVQPKEDAAQFDPYSREYVGRKPAHAMAGKSLSEEL